MKPVAIFRHSITEGPGYFATYLDNRGIPWTLVRVDAVEPVPDTPEAYAGLGFMGGPMSVNDDLPWIASVLALIRRAVADDVPVIGHCLGGQLISRALGGTVTRNPVKEIGWGEVSIESGEQAKAWFGPSPSFLSFHWHGETFSIPPGAARLAGSRWCANQAFVLGKHIGMQCHVEMTPELIRAWCSDWEKEVIAIAQYTPSVQTPAQMEQGIEGKVRELNAIAAHVYERWVLGLR